MTYSEHLQQKALIQWANLESVHKPALAMLFSIPNGARTSISIAKRLKAEGLKAGVPDLFLAIPNRKHAGLFIEMKSAKGRLSREQALWHLKLESWGYCVGVTYSWEEAKELILEYLRFV